MRIRRNKDEAASSSSSSSSSSTPSRQKKRKSLDAICEKEYNRNRNLKIEIEQPEEIVRRSSRVRRAPVLLDVSPSPKKKKRKTGNVAVEVRASDKGRRHDTEEGSDSWKLRLRSKRRFDSEPRKRKLFYENDVVSTKNSEVVAKPPKVKSKTKDLNLVVEDKVHVEVEQNESNLVELDTIDQYEERKDCMVKNDVDDELKDVDVEVDKAKECSTELKDVNVEVDTAKECSTELKDVNVEVDKAKECSTEIPRKKHIREGRRCGLCGRGTDGKPPKRLVDPIDSDHETYGGSSSCEEGNYDVLDGFADEPGWLGRLLGPIHDRFGIADVWVHQHCAVWSPEVYFAGVGCLKNVRAALFRGKALKCSRCGRPGATIGCRVDRCPKTYHLPCGRANGCIFDHRKFLIACHDHRHLFEPHTDDILQKLKKLKAKKLKLETRKLFHDAWRKDIEEEEKWLENCGEDEEFLKREGKRLHRDILRIAPVYIGGSSAEKEKNIYQGWESVAGLQDVIRCMKEVVLLPLLYPDFFTTMGLTPPRGVLLHGYPGTGKTHVVRALIGSCARGDRRIAYFARKGADCLGKYVGDAERQLRLLFQVAEKSQPSIIFFDEIDGLAPCRTRKQDQTHNSVVSTLLALMDGLKSRGSVIVIGATNRPDAVDPALRRPGRFDREIYFPLPSFKDRAAILSLHTQSWPKPISGSLLNRIVQRTNGFAGADLQALCTQAAMTALKRNCPLQEVMLAAEKKTIIGRRHPLPSCLVEETDWLDALACSPPPCSRREAGMAANDVISSPLHAHLVPCFLQPLCDLLISLYLDERIWLPPLIHKAAETIKTIIFSSLDQKEKSSDLWRSCIAAMVKEADIAIQIERTLSSAGFVGLGSSFSNYNDSPNDYDVGNESELCKVSSVGASSRLSHKVSCSGRKSGFRVLVAGNPKSGQRHLASCLLHGFVGCVEIQKVDLATISQEGHGDIVDGMTSILLRCSSKGVCIIYMPRIDLWALETQQVDEHDDGSCANMCESSDTEGPGDVKKTASRVWSSFMEQVDSISLSASLMILATSEVPSANLPLKISQFFGSNAPSLNNACNSQNAMPRFSVQVGESFDHDKVIDSSASQLSKDLVQQYVLMLHHKTHATALNNKASDIVEGNAVSENEKCSDKTDRIFVRMTSNDVGASQMARLMEAESRAGHPQGTVPRVLCNNKPAKSKCNMLLSISSFGYQILQYPHFAELCWATSKLKEGPCADINGPWKGWPFNSCIVRPDDSIENISLGRSSNNLKSKENFGVVRGLIAVGLLAYKGVYTSIREVCFEVRKVLELLVEQVNAKIHSGKDGSQFFYLLSQVAYLEDMVKSWAYTFQSLEGESLVSAKSNATLIEGNEGDHFTTECNVEGVNACNHDVNQKDSKEVNLQQESDFIGTNKEVGYLNLPDSEVRTKTSDVLLQESASLSRPFHGPLQTSTSYVDMLTSCNTSETPTTINNKPENSSSVEVLHGSLRTSEDSSALAKDKHMYFLGDDIYCNHKPSLVKSGCRKGSKKDSMEKAVLPSEANAHKSDGGLENFSNTINESDGVSVSSVSRLTCLYSCCSNCIDLIYILIRKVLMCEWKTIKSSWTVDDAHDAFYSLATNLHSGVRRVYATEIVSKSEFICKNVAEEKNSSLCKCSVVDHGQPNGNLHACSRNSVVIPVECSFHSKSKGVTSNATACTHSQFGLGLKFCFKDNILISSDPDKDVLFHCKFQNLCLNSLIEWLLTIKQPSS